MEKIKKETIKVEKNKKKLEQNVKIFVPCVVIKSIAAKYVKLVMGYDFCSFRQVSNLFLPFFCSLKLYSDFYAFNSSDMEKRKYLLKV
jgi:hypothetical protein